MNKILMIGASLQQNGGIATVEKLIINYINYPIEIEHITSHDEGSIIHRLIVFTKALIKLIWCLTIQKIALVHIHLSDGGSVLRKAILLIVAVIFGKPVLMHAHGAEFHVTYSKLPLWAQKTVSWVFRQSQGFIVLSNTWKDYYVSKLGLNPKQVIVMPNPTEIPAQIPNRANSNQLNLVFCGRVGKRKGAFDLIEAFAKLPDSQKAHTKLILAGDGEISKAQELADNLNLTEKVTFLGWINAKQMNELLSQANIFVLPSYNEGLPMAILEAMGWGLPIIATPVGGIPELVVNQQNGLLVTPGNIQELSQAIELLVADESLRLALGKVARKNVEPFDIKNYCHNLAETYYSISNFHPTEEILHEN
ncbi:group 1 glycosyl transferase [Tolypothrix tenuis PCC 7101]|uniref:Group 1 glycosyl transferase n=1 Tax=Tolypothrix tenuis PCC 7101 TaxID=231146 RepID=A0A1Z4MSV7_9CYAN|nr:glycosyltransferase family 4 protein [Aulosira sp. FACHB-113]BAY96481.1 group 1 glycosyl transferase [Tolypothrix tenuis PCC 7101]BAZ73013.1 group 1 glycosyl transferase [Aulosira laxa NIES-50]